MVRNLSISSLIIINVGFLVGNWVVCFIMHKLGSAANFDFNDAFYITVGFWTAVALFKGWM